MANVLFSAMRNEAPFILEWVAYHKVIGFDRIVVVSNNCTDLSEELLGRLASQGEIEHIQQIVPDGRAPQENAVALANDGGYLNEGDWGIFLDADEFLNVQYGLGRLVDLTDYLGARNQLGMLINWRVFGDAGHSHFPGRYVSPDFRRCNKGIDLIQFKTLFRKTPETLGFSSFLHLSQLEPGKASLDEFLSPNGDVLSSVYAKLKKRHRGWLDRWIETGQSPLGVFDGSQESYDLAQINHYMVRDPHSFRMKRIRGRGYAKDKSVRHTDGFYDKWNLNEAQDTSILRWRGQTSEEMARLTKTCGLVEVMERIRAEYLRDFVEPAVSEAEVEVPQAQEIFASE